jgi:hypothetical protein
MPGIARCLSYHVAPCQIVHPLSAPAGRVGVKSISGALDVSAISSPFSFRAKHVYLAEPGLSYFGHFGPWINVPS